MVQTDKGEGAQNHEDVDALKAKYADLETKHTQSTLEGQRLHHEIEFLKDPSYFEKLYQTNRNFAVDIAKKYEYDDVDEFLKTVKDMKPTKIDTDKKNDVDEDQLIDKALTKLEEKQLHAKSEVAVSEFLSERDVDLTSDFGKDVMAEYKDLVGSRKMTPEKATKYIAIAYKEAKGTSKHAEAYALKQQELRAVGMGGGNGKAIADVAKPAPTFNKPFKFAEAYGKKS